VIDLDAPISRYLPAYPDKGHPITARQLAGHTAGVRHYREGYDELLNDQHFNTITESLSLFRDDPLLFEPGTEMRYSSFGFNLLAAVMEAAANRPFLELMQAEVFDPFGMESTTADDVTRTIPARAIFYEDTMAGVAIAPRVDHSYKWAGGGFLSSPLELTRFGNALISGAVIGMETTRSLFTSQHLRNGNRTGYGLGFDVRQDGESGFHLGGAIGGTAALFVDLAQGSVVAFAANVGTVTHPSPERHTVLPAHPLLVPPVFLAARALVSRGLPAALLPIGLWLVVALALYISMKLAAWIGRRGWRSRQSD
jgi:CubicO group peptidase (beta-lactamase class C family)